MTVYEATMYESPQTLQDACIEFLCENVQQFFSTSAEENLLGNPDIYFPSNLSEQILEELGSRNKLNDQILLRFNRNTSRLQNVKIKNASRISSRGLTVLRQHKIRQLEVQKLTKLSVNELVGCLGEWTLCNLLSLNVSHCTFKSNNKICVMVALSKLKNLLYLNVSNTEFSIRGLDIITQDLPQLEKLDISETMIRDISPLKKCRNKLKSLNMYNLKIAHFEDYMSVIHELRNLCFLDVSDDSEDPFNLAPRRRSKISELLKSKDSLPCIVWLDISGNEGIQCEDLRLFLASHPSLRFLGLMLTEACAYDMFTKESDPLYRPNLEVSGTATAKQVMCSLEQYPTRRVFVQKSLYYLYSYTQNLHETKMDIIKLVLNGMKLHSGVLSLQLAATACLYNLTKGNLVSGVHPHWLKKVVELALVAMKDFPKHQQLQKNALLILCSDKILQDVSFDRFRCTECVLESLVFFDDPSMNRMSAAICSILAAKISTSQTTALGTKPAYMERLLSIVHAKTEAAEMDIMMKFTLSALWNLTDESPATCKVFLDMDGLDLFLKVLTTFAGECSIETKVLGLMNNIAEVPHLRPNLMKDEFLTALSSLLCSPQVDVSYFAAGIVAHMASDDPCVWTCSSVSRNELLYKLGNVVQDWNTPDTEMVAYSFSDFRRSFVPFLPLLKCYKTPEVQRWAVWAIHHVCSKNPKRYAPILAEDNGIQVIEDILQNRPVDPFVYEICHKILKVVNKSRMFYFDYS